ncbi:MAG: hypothetical protein Pg6C_05480 [Treponemataceae bacterium]|nr:MAG: hypothetical protein Pg6C_05480 [Treponemataceae bacterium]
MELALNEDYTFENFVAKGDDFAFNIAKRIAEKPGKSYNPVVFYGGYGSGKTHLIQAIGNELKKQYNVIYTTAELFCEEFIAVIKKGNIKQFKEKYRAIGGALLIDDMQFLQGKAATMEELCCIFDILYDNNVQMVFTADRQFSGIHNRLASRLSGGLTVNISPCDFEIKIALIKNIMKSKNISVKNDDIVKIANNTRTDMRYIVSSLNEIDAKKIGVMIQAK